MKHSFNIVGVTNQIGASFDDVVKTISGDEEILKLFIMHKWSPGRWMKCKIGFIFCVDKEIR